MKKLIALLLALVMVLGLVACGAKDAPAADAPAADAPAADAPAADAPAADAPAADDGAVDLNGKLGFFYAAPHPFGEGCKVGANAWAAEKGIECNNMIGPDWELTTQLESLEAMIADGCQVIGTFPMDAAVYDGLYEEKAAQGIIFNNLGWDSTGESSAAQHLISTNIYNSAYKSMEFVGEKLNYEGNVMLAYETLTDTAIQERKAAVEDYCKENPGIKIVAEAFDVKTAAEAAIKIENTLNANTGNIDAIVSLGATCTQALVGTLTDYYDRGGEKMVVVGIDYDDVILQGLRDGIMDATVAQNNAGIGYIGMEVAKLQMEGYRAKEGKYHIDTGIVMVTNENIDSFMTELEAVTQEIVATLTTEYMELK